AALRDDSDIRETYGTALPWVPVRNLHSAANRLLQARKVAHKAHWRAAASGSEDLEFIPNPRYLAAGMGLDVESRRRLASLSAEDLARHFLPTVRGVEDASADYFTGRTN